MLKPILDRVLLKRIEEDSRSPIELADIAKRPSLKGRVVAIGDWFSFGGRLRPVIEVVNVGDVVMFGEFTHEELNIDGEEFLLVRIADIKAIECGQGTESNDSSALTTSKPA